MPVNFSPNRIKLRLCTYRKLNLILINSIYLVFFYLKYSFFKIYFSLKKRKIFKFIKLAKNVLSILFLIDTSCFDEWFLFHVITEKNIAYKGDSEVFQELFWKVNVLKEGDVFKEVHIWHYLHNDTNTPNPKFYYRRILLFDILYLLNFLNWFYIWLHFLQFFVSFCNCFTHFSLEIIFSLKKSKTFWTHIFYYEWWSTFFSMVFKILQK